MVVYQGFREEKVLIDGAEVNYKITGIGRPILVLHGWGGGSGSWIKVQEILADRGYRVIVPDFPGFGKSKTPPVPWSVDDYVNWLESFTAFLEIQDFVLLAHSFGGRVAVKFSAKHPEKITELILCASAGVKPKPDLKTKIIYWISKQGNVIFTSKILARFKDSARNLFYISLRHKDYVKARGTMKETIKNVLNEDLLPELPKITNKTLIIWGEKDKLVPVKYAYVFKENIENSQLEIMPGVGHSPQIESPEKLADIILNHINGVE